MKRLYWICYLLLISLTLNAQNREQLYQLGKRSFQDQLYTQAIEKFRSFMDYYSEDPRVDSALYMAGVSWYYLRSWNSAVLAFEQMEQQFPYSTYLTRSSYWKGLSHYSNGDNDLAYASLEKQISYSGEEYYYPRSLLYLGLISEKQMNWPMAEEWFLKMEGVTDNQSLLAQAVFRAGLSRMRQNNFTGALQLFQRLTLEFTSSPFSRDMPYYTGLCYTRMGDYEEANRRLRNYLQLNSQGELRDSVSYQLADNLRRAGETEEALTLFAELAESTDNRELRARSVMSLAALSLDKEEWDQAESWLLEVYYSVDGEVKWEAAYNLAQLYRKKGWNEKALSLLNDIRELSRGNITPRALLLTAHVYRESGDKGSALNSYKQYWLDYPTGADRSEAGRWMIALFKELNRLDEAEAILDSMLENYPDDRDRSSYLFMKGEVAQMLDKESEALEWFTRVSREYPESSESDHALYRIGYIYDQRGEHIRASEYFRNLLSGNLPVELERDTRYSLALAYYNGGNSDYALAELQLYLSRYPGDERNGEAGYFLGDIYFNLGDYETAYSSFASSAQSFTDRRALKSRYMQALCLYRQSDWVKGREEFLALYNSNPTDSWSLEALYMAGVGSRNEELYLQAENDLTLASEKTTGDLRERCLYLLTQVYLDQDKTEDALVMLNHIRAEFPEGELAVNLLYRQGDLAFSREDYREALEWYQRCTLQYPRHELAEQALLRGALCRLELLDYTSCQQDILTYLRSYESRIFEAQAARTLADSVRDQKDVAAAEALFGQVEKLRPSENLRASLFLAVQRIGGFPDHSEDYLEDIYNQEDLSMLIRNEALLLLAHNHSKMGETVQALDLYRVLISTDSGTLGAEAQFSLAGLLAKESPLVGAEEFMNLYYLYPQESNWAAEGLYRAWEIYHLDEEQQRKADIIADKLRSEFPVSQWVELLEE